VLAVYADIGGDNAFAEWVKENREEYYRIAARLIPLQVAHTGAPPTLNITHSRGAALDDNVIEMDGVEMLPESRPALSL
jgi:hypothetical protein